MSYKSHDHTMSNKEIDEVFPKRDPTKTMYPSDMTTTDTTETQPTLPHLIEQLAERVPELVQKGRYMPNTWLFPSVSHASFTEDMLLNSITQWSVLGALCDWCRKEEYLISIRIGARTRFGLRKVSMKGEKAKYGATPLEAALLAVLEVVKDG